MEFATLSCRSGSFFFQTGAYVQHPGLNDAVRGAQVKVWHDTRWITAEPMVEPVPVLTHPDMWGAIRLSGGWGHASGWDDGKKEQSGTASTGHS